MLSGRPSIKYLCCGILFVIEGTSALFLVVAVSILNEVGTHIGKLLFALELAVFALGILTLPFAFALAAGLSSFAFRGEA